MRIVPFLISGVVTAGLITALNVRWNAGGTETPRMGQFLSPQHGFWQNAESLQTDYSAELRLPGIQSGTSVYFDERMVPHIFAENEADAYFVQGFLHAKFRLWQMEFQTHAAAGRLSEVLGAGADSVYLNYDRQMRRLGMISAAETAVKEMEKDPLSKSMCDAYTAGVNAYLQQVPLSQLPLEYKLLDYQPEPWTNLKTALLIKYMSHDLTGDEHDFELTNARNVFSPEDFSKLYPTRPDSLDPIIPRGTWFGAPAVLPQAPENVDSLYLWGEGNIAVSATKPDRDNGSNNWAVAGAKTASGSPILCNDPHLSLSLPSIWFEVQLTTPTTSVYGVSLPGAPGVVIGFNENCSWGLTNAARDVKDYYEIEFRDDSRTNYLFQDQWLVADQRIEAIQVRGGSTFYDTVAYTLFGPVIYDQNFRGDKQGAAGKNYALRWTAHDPSNDLLFYYKLNRATNYEDYVDALQYCSTPGQNFAFATKTGDIAIWQQGRFPAKWKRQGDFVMKGTDSSFMWQGIIPHVENPHIHNPERGFVSSANQNPVDSTYPYYIGGLYDLYRGKLINRRLEQMQGITVEDMMNLQKENHNLFAETAMPVLLNNIADSLLDADGHRFLNKVREWNLRNDADEEGATIFDRWFAKLEYLVWNDEFKKISGVYAFPEPYTLIEALIRDTAFHFVDDISTPEVETLPEIVTRAFVAAVTECKELEAQGMLAWGKQKDSGIRHLLRIPALSRLHLNLGGGRHIINALKQYHGPSWKMVVELTAQTNAHGIFPGGQNGNPGSVYYDNFVDDWARGNYYQLWLMKKSERNDPRIRAVIQFQPQA